MTQDDSSSQKPPERPFVHLSAVGYQFADGWGAKGLTSDSAWKNVKGESGAAGRPNYGYVEVTLLCAVVDALKGIQKGVESMRLELIEEFSKIRRQQAAKQCETADRENDMLNVVSVKLDTIAQLCGGGGNSRREHLDAAQTQQRADNFLLSRLQQLEATLREMQDR